MDFQTDMNEREYWREGLLNLDLPISPDVKREQEKLENADCVIFLYPVWWSDCPAKLKGWFDRVYTVSYAYGYGKSANESAKMKTVKYGIALCTAGHPNKYLEEIGIAASMRNIMIDDRLGQRFNKKEMIILGGTLELEKVKSQHFEIVRNMGKRVKKYCSN